MKPFEYASPATLDEATSLLGEQRDDAARPLAGGTDLLPLMKADVTAPSRLVNIKRLGELSGGIEETAQGVTLGALTTLAEIETHSLIQQRYPLLSEAAAVAATPQLRNMATTGGNLMQRTRCYYFRDPHSPCNKRRPGSGCAALDGYNRIHAVLGTSERCIAAHPSNMCVVLTALDAVIRTRGPRGERSFPITEFYVAYGDDPARETVLEHGELITAVEIPNSPFAARSHCLKVRDRASYEFALASAAVALELREG